MSIYHENPETSNERQGGQDADRYRFERRFTEQDLDQFACDFAAFVILHNRKIASGCADPLSGEQLLEQYKKTL